MGRIFSTFLDHNDDGELSEVEFQNILSTVEVVMTREEACMLIKVIVNANKSDEIDEEPGFTKEVFFQWYANQLNKENDKQKCAAFLFSVFDTDKSGDITVLEFKQQLDKLALGVTQEEANELIAELDQDGNGVLCELEFEEMIERFWPLEYEELVG